LRSTRNCGPECQLSAHANQRFANDWPQPIVNIRWLV
jgi:hypothetical protein